MRRSASSGPKSAPTPASRARPERCAWSHDEPRQALAPPAVETVRLCVFVDQTLELARVTGQTGGDERWRQMADGHRRDPPFGLRGLAGIADDEGIEHRQRTEHRLGETGRRQRHRLARQPFERAVRAHVHERVDLMLQPQAEGDECVPRRQCRIVVVGASIARAAAVGRERDQDIAERARSETERAVAQIRIVGRVAPRAMDERRHVRGQVREPLDIGIERQGRIGLARVERLEQRPRRGRRLAGGIARRSEVGEQGEHARRHIEPDGVALAAGRARIVRHQDRDAPPAAWQRRETCELRDAIRRHGDPVRLRAVHERGEGELGLRRQRILEGDRPCQHAAIELRQYHMHGEVGGAEAARAVAPGCALGSRDHDLQHRHVGAVERGRFAWLAGGGECGRCDDDCGRQPRERAAHEFRRRLLLEARDHERRRRKTARRKRLA